MSSISLSDLICSMDINLDELESIQNQMIANIQQQIDPIYLDQPKHKFPLSQVIADQITLTLPCHPEITSKSEPKRSSMMFVLPYALPKKFKCLSRIKISFQLNLDFETC